MSKPALHPGAFMDRLVFMRRDLMKRVEEIDRAIVLLEGNSDVLDFHKLVSRDFGQPGS